MNKKQMKNSSVVALIFAIVILVGCTPKTETNIVNENTKTNKNTSMLNKRNQNTNMLNRTNTNIADEINKGEYLDKDNVAQNIEDLNRDVVAKSDKIEREINKLDEVTDSRVIVSDGKAVVGVKVENGMNQQAENIKTKVETAVKNVDNSIKSVVVSMEESDYTRISGMEDRLRNGSKLEDMKDDFDSFVNRLTT